MIGCQVKNAQLEEELSQVDYIFCDKTGTLTQNELIFRAFKVACYSDEKSASNGEDKEIDKL